MTTHFRPAIAADLAALVDIECRAFRREGTVAREQTRVELERELADYVVLIDDESPTGAAGALRPGIVATARVQRHWLWAGECKLLKGDVGHVAVAPEAQGRGYGTDLMARLLPYMRETGCHLSRLGGLMRFYARFGYEPFLRRYVHIPAQPADCDLKGSRWGDLHAIPTPLADCVRIYNPSRHALAVHELRLRFTRQRPGAPVLDETPPAPTTEGVNLKALDWVYEVEGEVRGFLRGGHGLVNAGDTAPSFRVDDLAYDLDCPEAVEALVKTLLWRAMHHAPGVISCRLPYDERLFTALTAGGIAFEIVEMRQAVDGNMMQVVDLPGTLQAIAPQSLTRLLGTGLWQGKVRFELPGQQGLLDLGGDGECAAKASHADFLKCLFGIAGFSELPHLSAGLTPQQRLALSVAFPRTACASGAWG